MFWRGLASTSVLGLLACVGCHQRAEKNFGVSSSIKMADPSTAKQLVLGFHALENNTYRWTARKFGVNLLPPPGAEQRGGRLELNVYLPDGQITKLGPMTLSADVDGYTLPPETFTKGGGHTYSRDVPRDALRSNLVPVIFSFDKSSLPTEADGRELAAVITSIDLQSK